MTVLVKRDVHNLPSPYGVTDVISKLCRDFAAHFLRWPLVRSKVTSA